MRFVLFYSGVESFNYFTDRITEELVRRGHSGFILDLNDMSGYGEHSFQSFQEFLVEKVDVAIAFDGLGIKDDMFIELWDSMETITCNILMDHPLRFHPTMCRHPKKYIQFCCDRNHVKYVKKYFKQDVENVCFMPHAGTYAGELQLDDYGKRPYDVVFSGTYYNPSGYLTQIDEMFKDNELLRIFYHNLADYMIGNNSETTEQAVLDVVDMMGLSLQSEQIKQLLRFAEPIDWMARMYYREKVVSSIATAGIDMWLLGRGWENHPSSQYSNIHIINDRVSFKDTLPVMAKAKINLNVMPWFKDGTHDRIFNILLQGSLPVTDSSKWLLDNYVDGRDIAYYSLDACERVPDIINKYLEDEEMAKNVIYNGFIMTAKNFTWSNIVDQILNVTYQHILS